MNDASKHGDGRRQAIDLYPFVWRVRVATPWSKTTQRRDSRADQHIPLVGWSSAGSFPTPASQDFGVLLGNQGQRMILWDECSRNIHGHVHLKGDPRTFVFYRTNLRLNNFKH